MYVYVLLAKVRENFLCLVLHTEFKKEQTLLMLKLYPSIRAVLSANTGRTSTTQTVFLRGIPQSLLD